MPETSELTLKPSMGTPSLMQPRHKDDTFRQRILCTFRDRRKGRKTMEWNNGKERRSFFDQVNEDYRLMRESGMSEENIRKMQEFDLESFKRDRAYAEWTVSVHEITEGENIDDEWGMNPLLRNNLNELSTEIEDACVSPYWWINKLETPYLQEVISSMTDRQKELITLLVYKRYSQEAVAEMWKVSQQAVSKQWNAICRRIAEERDKRRNVSTEAKPEAKTKGDS